MKKLSIVGLSIVLMLSVMTMPANAETLVNDVITIPFGAFIPCANGGAGEVAVGTINLHVMQSLTVNGNRFRFKFHNQPQGGALVGTVTGDTYRAVGVTQGSENGSFVNGSYNTTFVNNFRIIGPGPGNNMSVHINEHVTINANGTVTSNHSNANITCK